MRAFNKRLTLFLSIIKNCGQGYTYVDISPWSGLCISYNTSKSALPDIIIIIYMRLLNQCQYYIALTEQSRNAIKKVSFQGYWTILTMNNAWHLEHNSQERIMQKNHDHDYFSLKLHLSTQATPMIQNCKHDSRGGGDRIGVHRSQ